MAGDTYRDTLPEGYQLHWYRLESVIGRGGYGITYLAHDTNLDQPVAIKEYLPVDFATRHDDETVHPITGEQSELFTWGLERFLAEARTLARFRHPNIINVYSVFEQNQTAYMVMEYARGRDLASVYRDAPGFSEQRYLDIFLPIMDGLALVHEAGFIHRDIKPANIYIREDDTPVLLDFGSARQSLEGKTHALTSLVTFGYAPYEQFNEGNGKQGPWTDIYGLGASIYAGITGKKPLDALKRASGILDDQTDPYRPVSELARGRMNDNFLHAVDYALRFRVEDRPGNIRQWADMLSGRVEAPPLLPGMQKPADSDDTRTVVRPRPDSGSSSADPTSQAKPVTGRGPGFVERARLLMAPMAMSVQAFGRRLPTAVTRSGALWALAGVFLLAAAGLYLAMQQASPPPGTELTERPDTLRQVTRHVDQATAHMASGQLLGAGQDNALHHYMQAYALDPASESVNRSISQLLDRIGAGIIRHIDSAEFEPAEEKLALLEQTAPDAMIVSDLRNRLAEKRTAFNIEQLLMAADHALAQNMYRPGEQDGAYGLYRRALQLDGDNARASEGIRTIADRLFEQAKGQLDTGGYVRAETLLADLRQVRAQHPGIDPLQKRIDAHRSTDARITELLRRAERWYDAGQLTRPDRENALDAYRRVLSIDRNNPSALRGIANIRSRYEKYFQQHLARGAFDRARRDIDVLKTTGMDAVRIQDFSARLDRAMQNQQIRREQTRAATAPSKTPAVDSTATEQESSDSAGQDGVEAVKKKTVEEQSSPPEDNKASVPLGTFF
jgi:serine/threonine protein kinase